MTCAAIVVNFNGGEDLSRCLAALAAQTVAVNTVVVDCASSDRSRALALDPPPGVLAIPLDSNLGYAGGANAGIAALDPMTEFVGIFNPDCFPAPGFFAACLDRFATDPRLAIVAPRLERPDGRLDSCGQVPTRFLLRVRDRGYGEPPSAQYEQATAVLAACGAGTVARVAALRSVCLEDGPFPTEFFAFWEDFDLGWRLANAGWSAVYEPRAAAVHRRGATARPGSGRLIHRRSPQLAAAILVNRWATLVHNLHAVDFLLRLPVLLPADMATIAAVLVRRPAVAGHLVRALPRLAVAWRRRRRTTRRRLTEIVS